MALQFCQRMSSKDTSVDKVHHRKERASKHKECSHMYKGQEGEDDEEDEVMAAICHSSETYSAIKPNREDEEYYRQLN